MEEIKKCLKDLAVFSRLNNEEIQILCEKTYEKTYNGGEIIFFENDEVEKLYFLTGGRVKLTMLSPEGKEKVMTILQEGDIFGEISIFDHDPHPLTAEVVEKAHLMIINLNDLEAVIMSHPGLAIKIIEALARKTRLLTSQVRELVFKDATGRLASLLNRLSLEFGVETDAGIKIELVLTHQELANLVGVSRVTVTKLINKFIDYGIIKTDRRKIVILDRDKLQGILVGEG